MIDLALPFRQFFPSAVYTGSTTAVRASGRSRTNYGPSSCIPCRRALRLHRRAAVHQSPSHPAPCRGADQHQPVGGVGPNVCLHPEVPLVAFLGRTHLRIAFVPLLFFVEVGAATSVASTIVPMAQDQAALTEQGIDLIGIAVASPWRSSRWRNLRIVVSSGIPSTAASDRRSGAATGCRATPLPWRVRIGKPLLHEVNAQHGIQCDRAASFARFGIVRLDQRDQPRPGHNPVHLDRNCALRVFRLLHEARIVQAAVASSSSVAPLLRLVDYPMRRD